MTPITERPGKLLKNWVAYSLQLLFHVLLSNLSKYQPSCPENAIFHGCKSSVR